MLKWICAAIETIRMVSFNYDSIWYSVEPFVYGTRPDGEDVLVAYVVRANVEPIYLNEWKVFEASKLHSQVINYDAIRVDREGMPEVELASIYCQVKKKEKKSPRK